MAKVGFVGLGGMGGHMARNLVAAGHELKVFDLVEELMAAIDGAASQSSAQDAASGVDYLISMLPAGKHVMTLYQSIFDSLSEGTLLIDCSTIDAATARNVSQLALERGLAMLDAPVSGGTGGAEAGTLSFMIGGSANDLEKARALFEVMGSNIFHAGDSGAGQIAKACNNMLLAVHMAGTAEALAMGVKNGLDPAVLSEVMKLSSGGNWSLNVYNPYPGVMESVPASRGYEGGFLVDLMAKDLDLAMDTAAQSRSSVPMGALAKSLYRMHEQANDAGGLDFSSIQMLYTSDLIN